MKTFLRRLGRFRVSSLPAAVFVGVAQGIVAAAIFSLLTLGGDDWDFPFVFWGVMTVFFVASAVRDHRRGFVPAGH